MSKYDQTVPHSYEDTPEGFDIGDTKEFNDGSKRTLSYTGSGVRRWMSDKDIMEQKDSQPQQSTPGDVAIPAENTDPKLIDIPEWAEYNFYLTKDNPFLQAQTLAEMDKIWFDCALEYYSRILILEDNRRRGLKSPEKASSMISKVEEMFVLLDRYFLAYQMYKMTVIIHRITEMQPSFDFHQVASGPMESRWGWEEYNTYLDSLTNSEGEIVQ